MLDLKIELLSNASDLLFNASDQMLFQIVRQITKLCVKMRPYLALKNDIVVQEGEIGEEMYMIVRGSIKLQSLSWRLYNNRSWHDGAFFGELTVLGIGGGPEHNRHVYSATAALDSECIFITQDSMDTLQILHPTFKDKMRKMAIKRAERFGYGERAEQVRASQSLRNSDSDVVSVLDRTLDSRQQVGSLSGGTSKRVRMQSSVSGPSLDGVRGRNQLQTEISGAISSPSGSVVGRKDKTLQLQDQDDLQQHQSAEKSTRSLLQELVSQNARLADQVECLTDRVEFLLRRSPSGSFRVPPTQF